MIVKLIKPFGSTIIRIGMGLFGRDDWLWVIYLAVRTLFAYCRAGCNILWRG